MKTLPAGTEAPAGPSVEYTKDGRLKSASISSDALNQQPASEVNKLFDAMCGVDPKDPTKGVYTGPRWWEDPEKYGYKVYNGRDE
jgi:hypothetical protein